MFYFSPLSELRRKLNLQKSLNMFLVKKKVRFPSDLVWQELNRIVKHDHHPVTCLETLIHILRGTEI